MTTRGRLQVSRDVCPLTAFIIWVPREGRAKKELRTDSLVLPLRPVTLNCACVNYSYKRVVGICSGWA